MRRVLVLGATSTITGRLCRELAAGGDALYLAGRDLAELERQASDLRIRYRTPVWTGRVEAEAFDDHPAFVDRAAEEMGGIDGVVFSIGLLGKQPEDSVEPAKARRLIDVNLTSAVTLLGAAAERLRERGDGFVLGLSSVAGDRGRQSNFVYGAAKGGFSIYLQGLRNRLDREGVKVYTVKLGVVDTAMTYGMEGLPLAADAETVARSVCRLLDKPAGVYYVPWFWRGIMAAIKLIPERLFKRLRL